MSEARDFLKRLKQEGLIHADVTCGKEHVIIREKTAHTAQDSKTFQHVKTQLMRRKKIDRKTLLYILGGVLAIAILISFMDSNISGFYRSLFFSGSGATETARRDNANLSTAALAALDSAGKSRELIRAIQNGDMPIVEKLLKMETDINGTDEKGNTPLVAAINSGNKDMASLLLDNGASLDASTKSGVTPAMAAAKRGDGGLLDRLLKNGAKSNQVDRKGNSALSYAVQSGCAPCVSMILARGSKPDSPNGNGQTPLLVAASKGNLKICELLLKNGATVNRGSPDGTTPLMKAAGNGNIELVQKLIAAGAALDTTSNTGDTALAEAAVNKHPDMVHLLLSTASEKNISFSDKVDVLNHALKTNNETVITQLVIDGVRKPIPIPPVTGSDLKDWNIYQQFLRKALGEIACSKTDKKLRTAAANGNIKAILAALKEGADLASANKNNDTAVMLAVRNHQLPALKTLLGFGAPVETINRDNGDSPLLLAAQINDPRFTSFLLQAGANPNTPGPNGYTAMDYAFATGNRLVIPVLAKAGAKAATEWNKNQWTPLEYVIVSGKTNMLDMLIRNSADIDKADANGWSALHYAAMLGKPSLVKKLLKKGADVNLEDNEDWNPLHFSVLAGRLDVLKILLSNDAKVNRRNKANWPPLYLAIALRHPDMTKALLKAGAKTRHKSDEKVVLPPFTFPRGYRAENIVAKLLRENPKDAIAKEIQKALK